MISIPVISHRPCDYFKIPPLLWIHRLNKTDFTLVQTAVPVVLYAGLLKVVLDFDVFLSPLMSNTKTKAFTEALCEQSSIPEVANSWTTSVGLSLCQCFFSQPEQSNANLPACPVQLWKYHLGFIVLLSITTSKWHKVSPLRDRCLINMLCLDGQMLQKQTTPVEWTLIKQMAYRSDWWLSNIMYVFSL